MHAPIASHRRTSRTPSQGANMQLAVQLYIGDQWSANVHIIWAILCILNGNRAGKKCQHDMKRVFGGFSATSRLVMMSRVGGRDVSLASAARRVSQLHRALSWRPLSASCRLCRSTLGETGGEKGGEEGRSLHLVTSFCSIWVIFQAAGYVCSQTFFSEATTQCIYVTTTDYPNYHFISTYMAILS